MTSLVAALGAQAAIAAPSIAIDRVDVSRDTHHDLSSAIRDRTREAQSPRLPHLIPLHRSFNVGSGGRSDEAVQDRALGKLQVTLGVNVLGVGTGFTGPLGRYTTNSAPPDTNGAVGDIQVVELVNSAYAVFDKSTGAVIAGPIDTKTLWAGFGGGCEKNDDGDGVVLFDKTTHRWILSQFSTSTKPYLECVAVSQTNDATGKYYRYSFAQPYFNDYPKLGVWSDAVYATYNLFSGNNAIGARACAMDRSAMVTGASATQECFTLRNQFSTMLPSDMDGATPPPAGAPNYMVAMGTNNLQEWSFHADFTKPANAKITGPVNIATAAFKPACTATNTVCVPQKGTSQKIDTLSDRLMFRLAYRNFAGATPAHESLVVTHTVKTATNVAAVRWYEIRSPGSSPTVFQQGTYAPDATDRFVGSAAMDKVGNLLIGYSASSATLTPSIRLAGRLTTDAPGVLSAEAIAYTGGGSEIGGASGRWGDYSAMSVDPVDDCTFWYFNQYYPANSAYNWSTRVLSAKFPSCN